MHPDPPADLRWPILEKWEDDACYYGVYFEPGGGVELGRALGFLCDVLRMIPQIEVRLDDTSLDLVAIDHDPSLEATTRKQLIDARIGQGAYRQGLEERWGGKCAVLGVTNKRVLRASHVKPWRLSNNQERLDPNNGLLLSAHLDALFDAGLITFSSSGDMIVASDLLGSYRELLQLGARLRHKPSPELQRYLQYHHGIFNSRQGGRDAARR